MLNFAPTPPAPVRYPSLSRRGPSELVMLASQRWTGDVPGDGLIVAEKIDGVRALWINGTLTSREGIPIQGTDHIAHELRTLEQRFGEPMMFDGELQVAGALRPTLAHFASHGSRGDAGRLHLFDAVPLEQWRRDSCEEPLTARLNALAEAMEPDNHRHVGLIPWRVDGFADGIREAAASVWARGGEGLVLKVPTSSYRRRRSADWMKVKR